MLDLLLDIAAPPREITTWLNNIIRLLLIRGKGGAGSVAPKGGGHLSWIRVAAISSVLREPHGGQR